MKKLTIILIILLITLSACAGNSASLEGEWKLVAYGNAANPTPALPNAETSINFGADGQFGGTVGCNTFGGKYKVSGDEITFSGVFSTEMFCEETSEQESLVLGILSEKTMKFQVDGDRLTLTSLDDASVVVLGRK